MKYYMRFHIKDGMIINGDDITHNINNNCGDNTPDQFYEYIRDKFEGEPSNVGGRGDCIVYYAEAEG